MSLIMPRPAGNDNNDHFHHFQHNEHNEHHNNDNGHFWAHALSTNICVIMSINIRTAEGVPNYREHCTVLTIKQVRPPNAFWPKMAIIIIIMFIMFVITKMVKMIIIIIISPAGPFIDNIR